MAAIVSYLVVVGEIARGAVDRGSIRRPIDAPRVTEMQVIPSPPTRQHAAQSGAALTACFTRNLVILRDAAGHTGVGEVPGGERIRATLVDAQPLVTGASIGTYKELLARVHERFGALDAGGRGVQTFDQRTAIHAVTAIEAALLDLVGQFLGVPVAALLGAGQQRASVEVLGYLFYVGDRRRTTLPYDPPAVGKDDWLRLRREEALNASAIVRLAEAAQARYGFKHFKLKGCVLSGEEEMAAVAALAAHFPGARVSIDPNGAWSLHEAIELCRGQKDILAYAEDPCGAEGGFSGREVMAEFRAATEIRPQTNMVATDHGNRNTPSRSRRTSHSPIRTSDDGRSVAVSELASARAYVGPAFQQPLTSRSRCARAPRLRSATSRPSTHWIWQDGAHLTRAPDDYERRHRRADDARLGVELDTARVEAAHRLYQEHGLGARDDADAMQFLSAGWTFDPKRRVCSGRLTLPGIAASRSPAGLLRIDPMRHHARRVET